MEILPHPLGPARPVLLLPDRSPSLDLVDQISPRGEGIRPMRRGNGHNNRDFSNTQLTDTMNRSNLADRPPLAHLADNLRDLLDDLLVVGLILEVGHAASARRVVAHGPHEEHHRASIRCRNSRNDARRIHHIGGHGDQIWLLG